MKCVFIGTRYNSRINNMKFKSAIKDLIFRYGVNKFYIVKDSENNNIIRFLKTMGKKQNIKCYIVLLIPLPKCRILRKLMCLKNKYIFWDSSISMAYKWLIQQADIVSVFISEKCNFSIHHLNNYGKFIYPIEQN